MEKIEKVECGGYRESLLKFLLVKTAPVMLKVRPAVLLRLTTKCVKSNAFRHYDQFCLHQEEIISKIGTDFMIMQNNGSDIQVMFFDRTELKRTLGQTKIKEYLRECGYDITASPDECLAELRQRFCKAEFPHEIGLFLGYPLKDVRGFIEKRNEAMSFPRALWRIFGDPAESLRRMRMYRFAEDMARVIIGQYESIDICIAKVKRTVRT